jgi:hypothetical protein
VRAHVGFQDDRAKFLELQKSMDAQYSEVARSLREDGSAAR